MSLVNQASGIGRLFDRITPALFLALGATAAAAMAVIAG